MAKPKTPPPTVRRLSGFDSFVAAGAKTFLLRFELEENAYEIELKPLTHAVYASAEALIDSVPVPLKDPANPYSFDQSDPQYQQQIQRAAIKRRVLLVEHCTGWHIPGETLDEKAERLAETVRPDMLSLLVRTIEDRFTRSIEATANFTFGGPSPESPPSATGNPEPTT